MEVLQSMVEGRKGGETGVASIKFLDDAEVWAAQVFRHWDRSLVDWAMFGKDSDNALRDFIEPADGQHHPAHGILIRYKDGMKATILRIGKSPTRWKFACGLKGIAEPQATSFYVGPWENRNLFKALAHAIQTMIREKRAPYPIERTHLVTGMLDAAMDSRFQSHQELATPQLNIAYEPRDFRAMREMGDSWRIITEDQPQPPGINPGGPRPGK
jgi:hypothetical protein